MTVYSDYSSVRLLLMAQPPTKGHLVPLKSHKRIIWYGQ